MAQTSKKQAQHQSWTFLYFLALVLYVKPVILRWYPFQNPAEVSWIPYNASCNIPIPVQLRAVVLVNGRNHIVSAANRACIFIQPHVIPRNRRSTKLFGDIPFQIIWDVLLWIFTCAKVEIVCLRIRLTNSSIFKSFPSRQFW